MLGEAARENDLPSEIWLQGLFTCDEWFENQINWIKICNDN